MNAEIKAKLEAVEVVDGYTLTPVGKRQFMAGASAAWDMAVQYATEKERNRCADIAREPYKLSRKIAIDELPGVVGKYIAEQILNPPEQKEEGDKL